MRVKVLKSFKDKYTNQEIKKDTELEITKKRFSELTAGPKGVFVKEIKKTVE